MQEVRVFIKGDTICGYLDGNNYDDGIMLVNIDHNIYKYYKSLFIKNDAIIMIGYL